MSTVLSAGRGVCMMSNSWRDKQHPNLINFIATFLAANSYRLNFLSVSPVSTAIQESHWFRLACLYVCDQWPENSSSVFQDFIFNNGGTSVAFIFETNWDTEKEAAVFSRWGRDSVRHFLVMLVMHCICCDGDVSLGMPLQGEYTEKAVQTSLCCCCPSHRRTNWII